MKLTKKIITVSMAFALLVPNFAFNEVNAAEYVSITDKRLKGCINHALAVKRGENMETQIYDGRFERNDITVEDAAALTELECTDLSAPPGDIRNLAGLEQFTALEKLSLNYEAFSDITPIEGLDLLDITLTNNRISKVGNWPNALFVNVSNNRISDVSAVQGMNQLVSLNLSQQSTINMNTYETDYYLTDITPIFGKTSITNLFLDKNNLNSISGLETLTNLQRVTISSNNLTTISPLFGLSSLREIDASHNAIQNVEGISALNQLRYLDLDGNTLPDLSSLAGLNAMEHLSLTNNQISDVSVLGGLSNLTWLELPMNSISDIAPLSSLANLEYLDIAKNNVTDISPLNGLANLSYLGAFGQEITRAPIFTQDGAFTVPLQAKTFDGSLSAAKYDSMAHPLAELMEDRFEFQKMMGTADFSYFISENKVLPNGLGVYNYSVSIAQPYDSGLATDIHAVNHSVEVGSTYAIADHLWAVNSDGSKTPDGLLNLGYVSAADGMPFTLDTSKPGVYNVFASAYRDDPYHSLSKPLQISVVAASEPVPVEPEPTPEPEPVEPTQPEEPVVEPTPPPVVVEPEPTPEPKPEPPVVIEPPVVETPAAEEQAPVVKAEDQRIKKGTKFDALAWVTAFDAQDGELDTIEVVSNNVDIETPGMYLIEYRATNSRAVATMKSIDVEVYEEASVPVAKPTVPKEEVLRPVEPIILDDEPKLSFEKGIEGELKPTSSGTETAENKTVENVLITLMLIFVSILLAYVAKELYKNRHWFFKASK